jgi:glyoxylase-like metal-dependent hydrolase (beta-lactamase superfamily II)
MSDLLPKDRLSTGSAVPNVSRTEILPGIDRIRLPLSSALQHVNSWLLRDAQSIAIIDTGMPDPATMAFWETQLAELADIQDKRLIVTHHHRDHAALIGWFANRWTSKICMTKTEWLYGHYYHSADPKQLRQVALEYYRVAGCPSDVVDFAIGAVRSPYRGYPAAIETLRNGSKIKVGANLWTVITAGGHSPELACLYCAGLSVLIAADQVLPKITPLIPVTPGEPFTEPLSDYLASLDNLEALPRDTLVLPSHGDPFVGLHDRIGALRKHHEERLAALRQISGSRKTLWDCVHVLFPRALNEYSAMFAVWETLAHVRHLQTRGQVRRIAKKAYPDLYEFH